MRRLSAVLLLFVVVFGGIKSEAKTYWSSARVADAVLCHGINQTSRDIKPVEPSDRFLKATPQIHAIVKYKNVPDGTAVRVALVYVGGEDTGLANEELIDVDHVIDKDIKQSYTFDAPFAGWPRGQYKLQVFINDQPKHDVPFDVYGPDPVPTIVDAVACRGVNPYDMEPINPSVWFEPDIEEIYISAKVMWALDPVQVKILWRYYESDMEPPQDILDYTLEATGNRRVKFTLSSPDNGWPFGNYDAVLFVDGRQVATVPFEVSLEPTPESIAMEEAQSSLYEGGELSPEAVVFFLVFWVIWGIFMIFLIVSLWKVFTKAGLPGWGVLIPFYNIYLYIKLGGKPGWWFALAFIPFVNLVMPILMIIVVLGIAERFGKGTGFGIGLILLPVIFFPILAFGSAQYQPLPEPAQNTNPPEA